MSGIFNLPAVMDGIEFESEADQLVIEGNTSLDFLQAIYRSTDQPMQRRMRAAIAALAFEHPKLSVTANVGPNVGFARGLERARDILNARARAEHLVIDGDAVRLQ